MSTSHLDVTIMGREYRVACSSEEQPQLLKVVALVDEKMSEIASRTRNAIPERVAVMAAMSIAHQLLAKPDVPEVSGEMPGVAGTESGMSGGELAPVVQEALRERLDSLVGRIDAVLQGSALH